MLPSPRTEWASVEQTILTPAARARRTCVPERSSRSGRPFTSSATPVSSATSKTWSRSRAFSGRWLRIRPSGCERHESAVVVAACRMASTTRAVSSAAGARWPAWRLICTHSSSREDVVRKVERAVGEDVALAPAEDPERRELLVRDGDLLGLAPQPVGVEALDDADGLRVVADRDVLVAEVASCEPELEHRGLSVRGRRMHVEVAANVRELEQIRRRIGRVQLAQLGWPEGPADRRHRRPPPWRARAVAPGSRRTPASPSPGGAPSRTRPASRRSPRPESRRR